MFLSGYGAECSDFDTDETCTQTCLEGYTDNNNGNGQHYTCEDGNFVGTLLVCKIIECNDLDIKNSENGTISGVYGDRIDITCLDGYSGDDTMECLVNGEWDNFVECEGDQHQKNKVFFVNRYRIINM